MKVLLIHLGDSHSGGGGGIAMHRLYTQFRKSGVDARILCQWKTIVSPYISTLPSTTRLESWLRKVTSRLGLNDIYKLSSFKIKDLDVFKQADIVDFQGIHSGTLSYLALPVLTKTKPAVFTLHDMWAFTGHCAYTYECTRWQTGCGQCPHLDSLPAVMRDGTKIEWKLKSRVYKKANLSFVVPSQWLVQQAHTSMLAPYPIHYIPHGVDVRQFQPLDPVQCRKMLGISSKKKVLLFVAQNFKDKRKGGDLLLKALRRIPATLQKESVLLSLGKAGEMDFHDLNMPVLNLGYVYHDRMKAIAYSAADLFLFPTRSDIFGLVSIESQACGTPVVSFRVGGVSEHVRSGLTGYLAEAENSDDFASGIQELLEDNSMRESLGQQGRQMVLNEYTIELQTKRYLNLYRHLMNKGNGKSDEDLTQISFENQKRPVCEATAEQETIEK
ncbi:MAG: glycosyltransferase [bacterium]